jgi:hypothetical protein
LAWEEFEEAFLTPIKKRTREELSSTDALSALVQSVNETLTELNADDTFLSSVSIMAGDEGADQQQQGPLRAETPVMQEAKILAMLEELERIPDVYEEDFDGVDPDDLDH